jgi:hypothetical protein
MTKTRLCGINITEKHTIFAVKAVWTNLELIPKDILMQPLPKKSSHSQAQRQEDSTSAPWIRK